jgi:hypothetical protein
MQFAYIMHQFTTSYKMEGGEINCCHLCVKIPSTGSSVVIMPHIILNKLQMTKFFNQHYTLNFTVANIFNRQHKQAID